MNDEANRGATQVAVRARGWRRRGRPVVSRSPQGPRVLAAATYLPTARGGFVVSSGADGGQALAAALLRVQLATEDQR
jgi:hypothetical protein